MRNNTKKRLAAAALAVLAVIMIILPSCGKKETVSDSDTVMTVGGYNVRYDLYRYFYLNYRSEYSADELSASGTESEIREKCEDAVRGTYASVAVASEYGLSPSGVEFATQLDEYIAGVVEQYGGKDKYIAALGDNHMTEDVFRLLLGISLCEEALPDKLAEAGKIASADDALEAVFKGDEFIRILMIFIENDGKREVSENRALAADIAARAAAGEDFATLISKYSNDYSTEDGYYTLRGDLQEYIENAAFALDMNGVSGVVESEEGFYIIKRVAKEDEYINTHFAELTDTYRQATMYNMIEEKGKALQISTNALYETLNSKTIKDAE